MIFTDNKPVAASILKLGESAKFCHINVNEDFQNTHLGHVLLTQMTLDALDFAKRIHFTLPESLWDKKGAFFRSFGFTDAANTSLSYRKSEHELFCSAPISTVYKAVLKKIPRLLRIFRLRKSSPVTDLLMSIKPMFAERILSGSKSVEIRKRFSDKWEGHEVFLYASRPLSALVGKPTVNSITRGEPDQIWGRFESNIGCSKEEFDAYVSDSSEIFAVELKSVSAFKESILLRYLSELLHERLTAPQSYSEIKPDRTRAWTNAIYLADAIYRRVKARFPDPQS